MTGSGQPTEECAAETRLVTWWRYLQVWSRAPTTGRLSPGSASNRPLPQGMFCSSLDRFVSILDRIDSLRISLASSSTGRATNIEK